MHRNDWIRQAHRWFSLAFAVGVAIYMLAMAGGQPRAWMGLLALIPLIALLVTGLYLFTLPYAIRWRRARGAAGA